MRTPPFLLGAALAFWGWQVDLPAIGILLGAILESSRFVRARWEFSDEDFSRIWTICTLMFLGIAVYAFTDNGGPARFGSFFQNPGPGTQSSAGVVTSRTASTMLRWLPAVLFLFMAAQAFSSRQEIPIATISLIMRRRWQKAVKLGKPLPAMRGMNVSYPYFAVCLFAASVHAAEDTTYFWGFCVLTTWALWVRRVRRFAAPIWATILLLVFFGGYFGQEGVSRIQTYLQNMDPSWFERFARRHGSDPTQTRTQIGRIGQLKLSGRIVIRMETEPGSIPPEYLREASYRIYEGERRSWKANPNREDFQPHPAETNNGAYVFVTKTNLNAVRIASYLSGFSRESQVPIGLLPLPSGVGQVEQLPAFVVKKNKLGAVLAEGPGLITFLARYGPGQTLDAPFEPDESQIISNTNSPGRYRGESIPRYIYEANPDLAVPPAETNALDQVIAGLNVQHGDRIGAMRAIDALFSSNFAYSTWLNIADFRSTNTTPLGLFLTRTHTGHCEYFATATVLLLRRLGVPARYAVGYAVHEKSGEDYVVRLRDAHAWCLVWNERLRAWQDFDTTPPSWIEEEAKNASPFQRLSDLWSWVTYHVAKFRWGQSNARQYMLLALVPATGLLAYQIFFRRKRRRSRQAHRAAAEVVWPGTDSEFYLIERQLAKRGLIRKQNEPLSEWLERAIRSESLQNANEPLKEILRLHYRYRFDPRGLPAADRLKLRDAVEKFLEGQRRTAAVQ